MRQHGVVGDRRARAVLESHETAAHPGVGADEEGRQAAVRRRVEEACEPSFREERDLGERDLHVVHGKGDRLAMEITRMEDRVLLGKEGGVVGDGIELGGHHLPRVRKRIAHGAEHLRDAAHGVGVLHGDAGPGARVAETPAPGEEGAQVGRRGGLTRVGPRRVHARVERLRVRAERLEDESRRGLRRRHQLLAAEDGQRRLRRLAGGAVHERQGLATFEHDGRDAGRGERLGRALPRPAPLDVALAHDRRRHVRQLDQVSARTDRADLRDDRMHAGVEHRGQRVDDQRAHGGPSLSEREGAHGHRRPHDVGGVARAEPGRVAAHEVSLEARGSLGGDATVAERTAAGVEPVDGAARARERHELRMARLEPVSNSIADRNRRTCCDARDCLERQRLGRREENRVVGPLSGRVHARDASRTPWVAQTRRGARRASEN